MTPEDRERIRAARNKAVWVFRDRYALKIRPYRGFIEKKAGETGQSLHQAAQALVDYVKDHDDDGTAQMLINAALADLIDPA